MATMGSNSSSGQIDGILNTLTYVQVVCLNFVACFFIAVLFGGAATFAAFAAFIAVLSPWHGDWLGKCDDVD